MMAAGSRRKGARIEREIVDLHREAGIAACRVPLSGAAGGLFAGDLRIGAAAELSAEVKARGTGGGFVTLERWLGAHDLLFLRRDRQAPLVVMPFTVYARLMRPLP